MTQVTLGKILYTVAENSDGELVKANDAHKGDLYFCPVCKNILLLRKSGKVNNNSKRPHFAHKSLTSNCTPESALHFAFKNLLAKKINDHIDKCLPLIFSWRCQYCNDQHSGNLLKKIKKIKVEHNLTICQPDIVLFDNDENVIGAIEIVVTHKPVENVLQYYIDNNIILIQINLKSDQDIDELENKISNPDLVTSCLNPRCKKCNQYKQTKELVYYTTKCEKCSSENIVAYISKQGYYFGIFKFNNDELKLANRVGLNTKSLLSKKGNLYLSNVCRVCNEPIKEQVYDRLGCTPFPPVSDMTEEEYYNSLQCSTVERLQIGYYCDKCE